MSRQAITIPAAGEEKRFFLTGKSVIIESGAIYNGPEEVPFLSFDSGSVQKPMYPQSTYNNDCKKFNSIVVIGTEASAGDVFYLYSSNDYLAEDIQIQFDSRYKTEPGTTFTKQASDTAQSLTELDLEQDGKLPVKLYVTVSPIQSPAIGGIKYAFNTDPDQGANTIGGVIRSPEVSQASVEGSAVVFEIEDVAWMLAFRFIAELAGETPVVNFTAEY